MPDAVAGAEVLAGRYELHEVLGRGGMADVYRATDRVLDRQVAVKLMRGTAENDNERARFTGEARTLAGLTHGGLVTVLDAGIAVEQPYLVMELVDGPTLSAALASGPMSPEQTAEIGRHVAEALAYAHGRGVVHRDVKPGNILLGKHGPRLADFGIARLIGDSVRHTRTGQAIGTAAYLAPEQVAGGEVHGAVDVYSLGLVLLECLTGRRAFPGPPTEAALQRLSRDPEVPSDLPEPWAPLLTAMTAREPEERPSAAAVAESLRTGAYVGVVDAGPATEAMTAVRSTPGLGAAAAGVGALGVSAAGATEVVRPTPVWRERLAALSLEQRITYAAFGIVVAIALIALIIAAFADGDSSAPVTPQPTPVSSTPESTPTPAPTPQAVVPPADGGSGGGGGNQGGRGNGQQTDKEAEKRAAEAEREAEKRAAEAEREAEKRAAEAQREAEKRAKEQAKQEKKSEKGNGKGKGN